MESRREALRGEEAQTLDLLTEVLTSEQWARLLEPPLKRAAAEGHRDLAQKLVEPSRDRREALRGAEEEALDLLAEELTSEQWAELLRAPLEHAARQGNRGVARKLVGAGAEIGDALHAAVRGGHGDVANDLLENGASVTAKEKSFDEMTPLQVAAELGKTEMVQLLLLGGANRDALDKHERTPFFVATECGHEAASLVLMAAGADVSVRCGRSKSTILHAAAQGGNVAILRAVIERGVDVDSAESDQLTPLHVAAFCNEVEAIDVLVKAGADVEARDGVGFTPLYCAAGGEPQIEALSALLKHGANVNAQNNYHNTPLHWAAGFAGESGSTEAVDLLLRSGADETILNDQGEAPVDVVGTKRDESDPVFEYPRAVGMLLLNAPADRAWRRRGYLVLCRVHPDRTQQQIHNIGSAPAGVVQRARSRAKLTTTETGTGIGAVGASPVDERGGGDWAVVLAKVLGLQEEGIFRTIVVYL